MKGFKQYIAEMAVNDAMSLLDLPSGFDKKELKQAYGRISKTAHPDKGGSHEMMTKVNAAYEILKKNVGHQAAFDARRTERRAEQADQHSTMTAVLSNLKSRFKYDIYEKHFEEAYGENFSYSIIREFPDKGHQPREFESTSYAKLAVEFFNNDRTIVYNVGFTVSYRDVVASRGTLGGGDVTYDMSVDTSGVERAKKKKMARYEWSSTNKNTALENPEQVFPMKKLKAKVKSTKFKKSDAISYIEKTLRAKDKYGSGKDTVWYLPTGEKDAYVSITRRTMLGKGMWSAFHINFDDGRRKKTSKDPKHDLLFRSFPENMETMEMFKTITKTKPDKVNSVLQKEYDRFMAKFR